MVRIFISYSTDGQSEAEQLDTWLEEQSDQCEVFTFQKLPPGTLWPAAVQRNLNICDCLIVLLSRKSMDSGHVYVEIQRAKDAKKPVIPVYLGIAPSDAHLTIAGLLHGINWTTWAKISAKPDTFAGDVIRQAVGFRQTVPSFAKPQPVVTVSNGTLSNETLYVPRAADALFGELLGAGGNVIMLVGPLQAGKSSLLARTGRSLRSKCNWIDLDLGAQKPHLIDLRSFLVYLIRRVEVATRPETVIKTREQLEVAADTFPEYLASRLKKGDVICIDEANFLFQQEYSNDFVDLLKTWKDFVARLDEEHHHSIVLSLSTEQYARHRLISYANPVPVEDFTEEEIEKLAELYNYKVTSAQAKILLQKTGGRPFLTGVFLAMLKAHVMTLRSKAAQTEAFDDKLCNISPMREHLTFLKTIVEKEEMATPLKLWLEGKPCHLEKIFGRLQELGILRGMGPNHASITGAIYNHYFRNYL